MVSSACTARSVAACGGLSLAVSGFWGIWRSPARRAAVPAQRSPTPVRGSPALRTQLPVGGSISSCHGHAPLSTGVCGVVRGSRLLRTRRARHCEHARRGWVAVEILGTHAWTDAVCGCAASAEVSGAPETARARSGSRSRSACGCRPSWAPSRRAWCAPCARTRPPRGRGASSPRPTPAGRSPRGASRDPRGPPARRAPGTRAR